MKIRYIRAKAEKLKNPVSAPLNTILSFRIVEFKFHCSPALVELTRPLIRKN